MRTAESFGVLPFYVVDWDKDFRRANRAAKGSDQWLEIERFRESRDAIKRLRGQGYKIYVSHLNEHSCELHELDFSQPSALVFGNENEGVHEDWVREADFVFRIPMRGFTQSYNTSVAAAISLTQVFKGSEGSFKSPKSLNSKEKELLRAFYYFRSVRRVGSILKNEILKKKLGKPAKGDLCT
jgi:tRNA (guanosine-2'-O-)-methyltransferase